MTIPRTADWASITLEDLGLTRTPSITPKDRPNEEFEVWSVPSFSMGAPEILVGDDISSGKQIVQPGDVLLCKINPRINRVWVVGPKTDREQIASTEWIVLRNGLVDPRFVMYRLREGGFRDALLENVSGVGGSLMRARPQDVRKLQVALPPLNEQRRIVAKLEALQERTRKAREALEAIPTLIEKFRQSILATAFRGDLTAGWRAKNPDVEPASVLLDRIRKERRKKWEESELAKMKARGRTPADNHWKDKYVEPAPVDTTDLTELPEGWAWVRADSFCTSVANGGTPASHLMFQASGDVPFVKVYNLTVTGELNFSVNPTFIPRQVHTGLLGRSIATPGDVLMNIVGPPLGKVSIIPTTYPEWNFNQAIVAFRTVEPIAPEFLAYYFLSDVVTRWTGKSSKATVGQFNISVNACRSLPVPIPPLAEQRVMTRRIKKALGSAGSTSELLLVSLARLEHLESSILAKAFRGELVPQDPNDEPASVLLERIRAEREASGRSFQLRRGPQAAAPPQLPTQSDAQHITQGPGSGSDNPPGPQDDSKNHGRKRRARTEVENFGHMDIDAEAVLCVLRQAMPLTIRYDRDDVIRTVARQLGFERTGSRIRDAIESALPTAARRKIAYYSGDEIWIASRTIDDYTRDELKTLFLAAIGTTWWERPDAIRAATRHLGFARTASTIEEAWKSIINGLIRTGQLEAEGSRIRRA